MPAASPASSPAAAAPTVPRAPAPRAHPFLGHALAFRRDPLALLAAAAGHGDVVPLRIGAARWTLVVRPDDVATVLGADHGKPPAITVAGRLLFGGALTALDGAPWARRRRQLGAGFHRAAFDLRGPRLLDAARAATASWTAGPRDLEPALRQLVLDLLAGALLGEPAAPALTDAMELALDGYHRRVMRGVPAPDWLPFACNRAMRRGRAVVDRAVDAALAARRRDPGDDLASRLLASDLDPVAIRDELAVMLALGAHQTALGLGWTLAEIAAHGATDGATDGAAALRDPAIADAAAGRAVDEALRLHPPFYLLARQLSAPVVLGEHALPAGAIVLISPWLTQRDRRAFDQPLAFQPARWTGPRPPRGAYLPFGAGARACVATTLARAIIAAAVRAIVERFDLDLPVPAPRPRIALGFAAGLPAVLRARPHLPHSERIDHEDA